MGGVLSSVIYGLPLKQVNSPFIINSGLRQSINPLWQFAYLLGQPVLPLQQMALGGYDSTVRRRKVLAHFDEIGREGISLLLKVILGSCRSRWAPQSIWVQVEFDMVESLKDATLFSIF